MNSLRVVAELLDRGLADWVSLHDVVWFGTHGVITPETKALVIGVLQSLFEDGLMVPGDLGETGFEDWSSPEEGWVARAESELDRLDWHPMGEGFWLRLTERGSQLAGSK